MAITGRSND